jgi:hypothetical protein
MLTMGFQSQQRSLSMSQSLNRMMRNIRKDIAQAKPNKQHAHHDGVSVSTIPVDVTIVKSDDYKKYTKGQLF